MKVLNFGSLNIDYTYQVEHIVNPKETISSLGLEVFPGGKGLNQSIALAKAGAEVYHAGLIGEDGLFLKEVCSSNHVHTDYIKESDTRTGNAIIQVSSAGENSIILFPGANRQNTKAYVDEVLGHFEKGDILLLQNEINEVDYLIEKGKEKGMTVAFNPSPFDDYVRKCDLTKVDLFFVNEVEGEQITGEKLPENIIACMREQFPEAEIVLTLGENGAIWSGKNENIAVPAVPAEAVDTTAAGDTFTGYFLAAVIEGRNKRQALERAAMASAMAVAKKGASISIPWKEEVDQKIGSE